MDEHPTRARRSGRGTDVFEVASGALGPVPSCKLKVRPLTVFVGAQGSGKSLVAQVIYALEELPFLVYAACLERGMSRKEDRDVFRWVLDHVRSADRAFGTFANPRVKIRWVRARGDEWPADAPRSLDFLMYRATRQVLPSKEATEFVGSLRAKVMEKKEAPLHHAIYFPTERLSVAGRRSRLAGKAFPQPLTYDVFEHWLEEHAAPAIEQWKGGVPPDDLGKKVDELGREALRGQARKYGERWKWEFGEGRSRHQFDLDMASSGQRSNFSIPYIAKTLFSLRGSGDVAEELTLLIEEPEISLHPGSQWSMMKMLALLVVSGFRVLVTTHSLTLIYALNNLLQASRVQREVAGIPEQEIRLSPEEVSVYAFHEGSPPRQLLDPESAFIDESELGRVGEASTF